MLQRYLATAIPMLVVDAIWLGVIARSFYKTELGTLGFGGFKKIPAILFYLGYPAMLMVLVLNPQIALGANWQQIATYGALFGLAAYGTYDLVNLSTLKGWSLRLTLVDMAWGTTITAFAAVMGYAFGG